MIVVLSWGAEGVATGNFRRRKGSLHGVFGDLYDFEPSFLSYLRALEMFKNHAARIHVTNCDRFAYAVDFVQCEDCKARNLLLFNPPPPQTFFFFSVCNM